MLDVGDLAKQEIGLFKCRHNGLYHYSVPVRTINVNTAPKGFQLFVKMRLIVSELLCKTPSSLIKLKSDEIS